VVRSWFVCGLAIALRRPGARSEFLPTVVLVSGTAAVAVMLTGATQASAYRGGDGLDPRVATFAFDLTGITLATMWVALGSAAGYGHSSCVSRSVRRRRQDP
jgi:hypothetical protein